MPDSFNVESLSLVYDIGRPLALNKVRSSSFVTAMLSASFALWLGKEASTNRVSKRPIGEENDRVS